MNIFGYVVIVYMSMYIVLQRIKKALLLSYNVSSGKAKVTEEDRKEIRCELIQPHVENFQLEFY